MSTSLRNESEFDNSDDEPPKWQESGNEGSHSNASSIRNKNSNISVERSSASSTDDQQFDNDSDGDDNTEYDDDDGDAVKSIENNDKSITSDDSNNSSENRFHSKKHYEDDYKEGTDNHGQKIKHARDRGRQMSQKNDHERNNQLENVSEDDDINENDLKDDESQDSDELSNSNDDLNEISKNSDDEYIMMQIKKLIDRRNKKDNAARIRWIKFEMDQLEAFEEEKQFKAYWDRRKQEDKDLWRDKDFANAIYKMSRAGYKGIHGNFEVPQSIVDQMNALYQQATVGDFDGNVQLKCADAWKDQKGKSRKECQQEFIRLTNRTITQYGWNPPDGWT